MLSLQLMSETAPRWPEISVPSSAVRCLSETSESCRSFCCHASSSVGLKVCSVKRLSGKSSSTQQQILRSPNRLSRSHHARIAVDINSMSDIIQTVSSYFGFNPFAGVACAHRRRALTT